eukprot:1534309-Lingulodinium_polyedra.AAC.1
MIAEIEQRLPQGDVGRDVDDVVASYGRTPERERAQQPLCARVVRGGCGFWHRVQRVKLQIDRVGPGFDE